MNMLRAILPFSRAPKTKPVTSIISHSKLLASASLKVGDVIYDFNYPGPDKFIPAHELIPIVDYTTGVLKDIELGEVSGRSAEMKAVGTQLVDLGVGYKEGKGGSIKAPEGSKEEMVRMGEQLEKLKEDPRFAKYIRDRPGKPLYLVVGLMKVKGAEYGKFGHSSMSLNGKATLPTDLAVPGTSVKASADFGKSHVKGDSYTATGESIIGMTVVRLDIVLPAPGTPSELGVRSTSDYVDGVTRGDGGEVDEGLSKEMSVEAGNVTVDMLREEIGCFGELGEEDIVVVAGDEGKEGGVIYVMIGGKGEESE